MILIFFNNGLFLRNVNAGKKIKHDLIEHMKLIENEEKCSINEKDVFEDIHTINCFDDYTQKTKITLYPWQKQIVQHAFYVSQIIDKNIVI
jgi:hypothetical protein